MNCENRHGFIRLLKKGRLACMILLFLLMIIFAILHIHTPRLVFKISACLCFVIASLINSCVSEYKNKGFIRRLQTAIMVAFVGDIVISFHFILGTVVFAIGHIFYYGAYLKLKKSTLRDFVISFCLFLIAGYILLFASFIKIDVPSRIIFLIYGAIISIMTGKAIGLYLSEKNKRTMVLAIGSVMFYLSDAITLTCTFSENHAHIFTVLGFGLYLSCQFFFAQTLFAEKRVGEFPLLSRNGQPDGQ